MEAIRRLDEMAVIAQVHGLDNLMEEDCPVEVASPAIFPGETRTPPLDLQLTGPGASAPLIPALPRRRNA